MKLSLKTKQEQLLSNALKTLIGNCIDFKGNAKAPTAKQIIKARKALNRYQDQITKLETDDKEKFLKTHSMSIRNGHIHHDCPLGKYSYPDVYYMLF